MNEEYIKNKAAIKSAVFSFEAPTPILKSDIISYIDVYLEDGYYTTPTNFYLLAKALHLNSSHESAIRFKKNLVKNKYIPHKFLTSLDFEKLVFDFLVFGNAYLEIIKNKLGKVIALKPAPALQTRVTEKGFCFLLQDGKKHIMAKEAVIHIINPDIKQEIYGLPEYLSALSSAFLNEAATLFRRKYYENGSHAGYILSITDNAYNTDDIECFQKELQKAKGAGNFKNLFLYGPGGDSKNGINIIPLGEATAKDDFFNIKNISREDILAAHRVLPVLIGVIPKNAGGLGSSIDALDTFRQMEIDPLANCFLSINEAIGEDIVIYK